MSPELKQELHRLWGEADGAYRADWAARTAAERQRKAAQTQPPVVGPSPATQYSAKSGNEQIAIVNSRQVANGILTNEPGWKLGLATAFSWHDPLGLKQIYFWATGQNDKVVQVRREFLEDIAEKQLSGKNWQVQYVLTNPFTAFASFGLGGGAGMAALAVRAPTIARLIGYTAIAGLAADVSYSIYSGKPEQAVSSLGMAGFTLPFGVAGFKAMWNSPKVWEGIFDARTSSRNSRYAAWVTISQQGSGVHVEYSENPNNWLVSGYRYLAKLHEIGHAAIAKGFARTTSSAYQNTMPGGVAGAMDAEVAADKVGWLIGGRRFAQDWLTARTDFIKRTDYPGGYLNEPNLANRQIYYMDEAYAYREDLISNKEKIAWLYTTYKNLGDKQLANQLLEAIKANNPSYIYRSIIGKIGYYQRVWASTKLTTHLEPVLSNLLIGNVANQVIARSNLKPLISFWEDRLYSYIKYLATTKKKEVTFPSRLLRHYDIIVNDPHYESYYGNPKILKEWGITNIVRYKKLVKQLPWPILMAQELGALTPITKNKWKVNRERAIELAKEWGIIQTSKDVIVKR